MTDQHTNPWLRQGIAQPPGLPRLLCLPYSAKGASLFRDWPAALAGTAEVTAVQLPAREDRLHEPPVSEVRELLDGLVPAVVDWWQPPVVVFAHCMGALVAGELLTELRQRHGLEPSAVVFSGVIPAWQDETVYDLSALSDGQLVRKLREQGALSAQMLAEPAVLSLMLPAAKADSVLCERIRDRGRPARPPLSCPLTLFAGTADVRFAPEQMYGWSALSAGPARLREFAGGHAFLDDDPDAVLDAVRELLAADRARER